jgi:hypothetical protein
VKDIQTWSEYYKKDIDDPSIIELTCQQKDLISKLNRLKHGSKILTYQLVADSEVELKQQVDKIIHVMKTVHCDSRLKEVFIKGVLNSGLLQLSEAFKNGTMKDEKFFTILKGNIIVEYNVPLDRYFFKESIHEAVKLFFFDGKDVHHSDWPQDVIDLSFDDGVIPSGF